MGSRMELLLQALRAGEADVYKLYDRFGESISNYISAAQKIGYICYSGDSVVKLTPLGLQACPKRRDKKKRRTGSNQYIKNQESTHAAS